jgi:hypothetical protein
MVILEADAVKCTTQIPAYGCSPIPDSMGNVSAVGNF